MKLGLWVGDPLPQFRLPKTFSLRVVPSLYYQSD